MKHQFFTPESLLTQRVRVLVLGAGGTGSEMLDALARINHALRGVGHPTGLDVAVADGDAVSATNVGRARFSPHDVGQNKAALLVHRYNLYYGTNWRALPRALQAQDVLKQQFDLLVTCVDKARIRVEIALAAEQHWSEQLWLDCGNGQFDGQVVLGHLCRPQGFRLPNVYDLFPEMTQVNDDAQPSCSMEEALRSQDLFINRWIADAAGALLWKLLRQGVLDSHGAFVNVRQGGVTPLLIDDDAWRFLGFTQRQAVEPVSRRVAGNGISYS